MQAIKTEGKVAGLSRDPRPDRGMLVASNNRGRTRPVWVFAPPSPPSTCPPGLAAPEPRPTPLRPRRSRPPLRPGVCQRSRQLTRHFVYIWLSRPTEDRKAAIHTLIADQVTGVVTAPGKPRCGVYGPAHHTGSCRANAKAAVDAHPAIHPRERRRVTPHSLECYPVMSLL